MSFDTQRRPSARGILITVVVHLLIGLVALDVTGCTHSPQQLTNAIEVANVPAPTRTDVAPPEPEQIAAADFDPPALEVEAEVVPDSQTEPFSMDPPPPDTSGDYQFDPYGQSFAFDARGISGDRYLDGSTSDALNAPEPAFAAAEYDLRYLDDFQPEYPEAARRKGQEGSVVVEVRIGADGRVKEASIAESSGSPLLDEAASRHARRHWRFHPATRGAELVESITRVTVDFDLNEV